MPRAILIALAMVLCAAVSASAIEVRETGPSKKTTAKPTKTTARSTNKFSYVDQFKAQCQAFEKEIDAFRKQARDLYALAREQGRAEAVHDSINTSHVLINHKNVVRDILDLLVLYKLCLSTARTFKQVETRSGQKSLTLARLKEETKLDSVHEYSLIRYDKILRMLGESEKYLQGEISDLRNRNSKTYSLMNGYLQSLARFKKQVLEFRAQARRDPDSQRLFKNP